METSLGLYKADIEVRQEGERPIISGRFPYMSTATISSRGRVRKERFRPRAFRFSVTEEVNREINLLSGHDYGKPLASRSEGTLSLEDTNEGLEFEAVMPLPEDRPSWVEDTLRSLRAGLVGGISPGFSIPPLSTVPGAVSIIPEPPSDGDAFIRDIHEALLLEMSLVTRAAYQDTEVNLRMDQHGRLYDKDYGYLLL